MVAHGAVAELPREQRARFEAQLARGMLKSLTEAMPAWVRSAGLDPEGFRDHFLSHAGARAAAQLQAVAAAVGWTDDLRPAMTALANVVQAVGLDNAPGVLAAAAERAAHANAPAAAPTPIVKAQELLFAQPPEEVVPPRIPMERVPGQSAKEAASDIPSFARGVPRYVGETPEQYARRVMDGRWGKGKWEGDPAREREFSQIKKYGSRAYRNPRTTVPGEENAHSPEPVA
jgi:hypothetical protein